MAIILIHRVGIYPVLLYFSICLLIFFFFFFFFFFVQWFCLKGSNIQGMMEVTTEFSEDQSKILHVG